MAYNLCELFCLLCCPPWPPKIAQKIAFQPPPPSYRFRVESDVCHFILMESSVCPEWDRPSIDCHYATTSRGNTIACILIRCSSIARYTLLFSHGNASDLGYMCHFYSSLGTVIGCNVFSYDYSGYGASTGRPSEKNMYADIECAWQTLRYKYMVPAEDIIVYGMSLGTVPSVDLAARHRVGAVILHSPLISALRILFPKTKRTLCCDAFSIIGKVPKIISPVLVIHGTDDEIIPFSHGVTIYESCRNGVSPLWVCGANHNDIEGYSQYIERLKHFVSVELDQYRNVLSDSHSEPEQKKENRRSITEYLKRFKSRERTNKCVPKTGEVITTGQHCVNQATKQDINIGNSSHENKVMNIAERSNATVKTIGNTSEKNKLDGANT